MSPIGSKGQACLLPVTKDLGSVSSGLLSRNTPLGGQGSYDPVHVTLGDRGPKEPMLNT